MKIIINASTLSGTGVTQVAVSFINECKKFVGNKYIVFLSPQTAKNIDKTTFSSNFTFYEFGKNWLYSIKGKKDIKAMKDIENKEKPDVVFSVFGPSLWRPKAPHLMGYAYPHYIYPDSPLFKMLSFKQKIELWIKKTVHMSQLKSNGDYYVCETDDVAERLGSIHNIAKENIFTAYNTASSVFLNYKPKNHIESEVFKFYSLCSPYLHKNLSILNKVIPLLVSRKLPKKIVFYTTFRQSDYEVMFTNEVKPFIINVGPLNIVDCPAFVDSCDALFLPTLLECYSASYPEAMALKKPIITSNLPFATTVCKDAAIYFDPLDEYSIVDKIVSLVTDVDLYNQLIVSGINRLKFFGGPEVRAKKYLEICKLISSK